MFVRQPCPKWQPVKAKQLVYFGRRPFWCQTHILNVIIYLLARPFSGETFSSLIKNFTLGQVKILLSQSITKNVLRCFGTFRTPCLCIMKQTKYSYVLLSIGTSLVCGTAFFTRVNNYAYPQQQIFCHSRLGLYIVNEQCIFQALLVYWTTSNFVTLTQVAILRIPTVREYFKIEKKIKHDVGKLPIKDKGFVKNIKDCKYI